MTTTRYSARADVHGTWSIFDSASGDAAETLGVLLVGLGEELAHEMADLLNLEESEKNPDVDD